MPDPTETARTQAGAARRGTADPVKVLLFRHRELCESAVDPLETAAGLEAHGITDRTALRLRHRDVFSLAEELYARVPQEGAPWNGPSARPVTAAAGEDDGTAAPPGPPREADGTDERARGPRTAVRPVLGRWVWFTSVPGAVTALALLGVHHTHGQTLLATALAGAFALSGTVARCLHEGPLRAAGRTAPGASLWVYGLLVYAVCGDGLLDALLTGGPHGHWHATLAPVAALAFAVAPAAWCAHLFAVGSGRLMTGSRGLAEFAAGARPVLLLALAAYVAALTGLAFLAPLVLGDPVTPWPTVALGTLLLLARLLTVHGFPGTAAAGLAAACAGEALACGSVAAGRLPGVEALAAPVTGLAQHAGAAAIPAIACGAAALGLLVHATVTLARASATLARDPAPS